MPNYLQLIADHYPGCGAATDHDPSAYEEIYWVDGDALPSQADLDAKDLLDYKTAKIEELSAACAVEIINGFESDALGTTHWYDSQPEDQMNLVGSVAAGDTMQYACRETQGGAKVYKSHTHAQLQGVLQDGRDIKLAKLQAFNTKRATVLACTTEACVDAVTWA